MPAPKPFQIAPVTVAKHQHTLEAAAVVTPVVVPAPYTPPSDYWANPTNYVSSINSANPGSGTIFFMPFDVGPNPLDIKGLGCHVVTAAVLGSATSATVRLGIYRSDSIGDAPDFTQLLNSGTADLTTSGTKYVAFGTPLTLQRGRYFLAFLAVYVGTPTNQATFNGCGSVVFTPAYSSFWAPGYMNRMRYTTSTDNVGFPTTNTTNVTVKYAFTLNTVSADVSSANGVTATDIASNNSTSGAVGMGYTTDPVLRVEYSTSGSTSPATAISSATYWAFTLSPPPGKQLDLSSITFSMARGGSAGPRGVVIRTSLDNYTADVYASEALTQRPTMSSYTANLESLPWASTPITFRVYFYTPTGAQSIEFDDITISGVLPPSGTPSLGSYSGTNAPVVSVRAN